MTKTVFFAMEYYDKKVIRRIIEKYDLAPMEAARRFLSSETHRMLENSDLGMMCFSELAIFDMWEAEQIAGDPRKSTYIRGE